MIQHKIPCNCQENHKSYWKNVLGKNIFFLYNFCLNLFCCNKYLTGELKMYAEMHVKNLHVMYPLFLKTLNNVGIYQQILINVSNIEFYENVLSSSTFLIC